MYLCINSMEWGIHLSDTESHTIRFIIGPNNSDKNKNTEHSLPRRNSISILIKTIRPRPTPATNSNGIYISSYVFEKHNKHCPFPIRSTHKFRINIIYIYLPPIFLAHRTCCRQSRHIGKLDILCVGRWYEQEKKVENYIQPTYIY